MHGDLKSWLLSAVMVGALGCAKKEAPPTATSAKPKTPPAAADAGPVSPKALAAAEASLDAMKKAATTCPTALDRCPEWQTFVRELLRRPGPFDVRKDEGKARMAALLPLLADPDPKLRVAARRVMELALTRTRYTTKEDREGWLKVLTERLPAADDVEQQDLLRILGLHGAAALEPTLLGLAKDGKSGAIRAAAWQALAACQERGCAPKAETIRQAFSAETDELAKGGIAVAAGRAGMSDVVGWCTAAMADDASPRQEGCRLGLRRLATPEAFATLLARATRLVDAPERSPAGDERAASALADLTRQATDEAGVLAMKTLLDRFLGQADRDGMALGIVAGQLPFFHDKEAAGKIALSHHGAYKARFGGPETGAAGRYALQRLERAVVQLGQGPAIGLSSPDGHEGHNHGGGPDRDVMMPTPGAPDGHEDHDHGAPPPVPDGHDHGAAPTPGAHDGHNH